MSNNNESFSYTYSAKQQDEIERIRKKYVPEAGEKVDKMEQLRRLDKSATRPGTTAALIVGVISTLIMGGGMSMCMVGGEGMFIPGIVIGIVGMIGVCLAYPLYSAITKRQREKIAPEIIRLSDELKK